MGVLQQLTQEMFTQEIYLGHTMLYDLRKHPSQIQHSILYFNPHSIATKASTIQQNSYISGDKCICAINNPVLR